MDGKIQPVIAPVIDFVISKGDVADGQVIEVPAVGGFKSGDGNVGAGIKLPGNPSGDGVQLHAIQAAIAHFFWQHSKEVANTHCRFQDVSGLESHLSYGIVDCPDDGGAGIVGIQGGTSGSGVFFLGQEIL